MSIPQALPTPAGEFQSQFGGSPDAAADCKKWESLCADLIAEREKLRKELARSQGERDQYLKSLYAFLRKEWSPPNFTREEVFAHLDDRPSIHEVIAELERGLEKQG